MNSDLPRPADILEELAEKVLTQIDLLSTRSFDSALDEMIEYHRFLLEAYGTKTPDGTPFSYAEISDWIDSPHHNWLRQYRRLFDRAVSRIDQDPNLIATLARTPIRLLEERAPDSSVAITNGILDLGITLVGRLENWITRRSFQTSDTSSNIELRGSDKTAFKDVIIDTVGAWEHLIQFAPSMYRFAELKEFSAAKQWKGIAQSLSFFRHHLRNTAYFVASATWNEDEIGSMYFQDGLVRWAEAFSYALPHPFLISRKEFFFPSVVEVDWEQTEKRVRQINGAEFPAVEPFSVFNAVLVGMHNDAILLTAAVLLRWHIEGKQKSEISLHIAQRLLNKNTTEINEDPAPPAQDFRSLLMQIVRIEVAGPRFGRNTYGETLDGIAAFLDQMTERDVISGRVYTPSTIHGREGLRLSFLAMLLTKVKPNSSEATIKQIEALAKNEEIFPQGDRTLANLIPFFNDLSEALVRNQKQLEATARYFVPDLNMEVSVSELDRTLKDCSRTIELIRTERVKNNKIDPSALERIRRIAEDAICTYPAGIRIFRDFTILRGHAFRPELLREIRINKLPKGVFTSPAMEWNWLDLDATIIGAISDGNAAWIQREFLNRKRSISKTRHEFENWKFWRALRHLASQAGPEPCLLLSVSDQIRTVLDWAYQVRKAPGFIVHTKPKASRMGIGYLASIDEIDVYGSAPSDVGPLVFSGSALKSITYHPVDEPNHPISLSEAAEANPWQFSLIARTSPHILWSDDPIFEIKFKNKQATLVEVE